MKSALFACIVAAAIGCNDRNSRETAYGTPGTGAGASSEETIRSNAAGHTIHQTGTGPETEASTDEQRVDRAGTVNENTGAAVAPSAEARRTATPTRATTPATPTAPTSPTTQTRPSSGFGMGMGTRYSGAQSTGVSETASGNGTTTNTGTNTENAGNGNTDNPQR
jgi:hypothetical protein